MLAITHGVTAAATITTAAATTVAQRGGARSATHTHGRISELKSKLVVEAVNVIEAVDVVDQLEGPRQTLSIVPMVGGDAYGCS